MTFEDFFDGISMYLEDRDLYLVFFFFFLQLYKKSLVDCKHMTHFFTLKEMPVNKETHWKLES